MAKHLFAIGGTLGIMGLVALTILKPLIILLGLTIFVVIGSIIMFYVGLYEAATEFFGD